MGHYLFSLSSFVAQISPSKCLKSGEIHHIIILMYIYKTLIFIFILALSGRAIAAQVAVITSPKAVIYSDQKLTTPLGYISYGKKITVGDVERKDGTVLPVIISGRVAYIQIKDINIKKTSADPGINTPKVKEHDIEESFKTDQDKLSENNFVSFRAGTYSGGEDWKLFSEEFDDTSSNLANFSILMEHRTPVNRMSWGFGISYYTVAQDELEAKTLTLDGTLYYALVHFRYATIEGFGGFSFSGDFKISQGGGEQITKGVLYGYNFGAIARLLPYSKIGFYGGFSIQKLYIKDLEPITNENSDDVTIGSLSGTNIFAGLSYKF